MDSSKRSAALEISDEKAKFLIGTCSAGAPAVLFYDERILPPGTVSEGEIKDEETLAKILSTFRNLQDEGLQLKVDTTNVAIVLPPIGLSVYQNSKSSQTIGDSVAQIDIDNVLSLLNREKLPGNAAVVDIVPDFFAVNGDRDKPTYYKNPPIGEKAESLNIQAKVYALPSETLNSYKRVVSRAGFRSSRTAVSSYLEAQMLTLGQAMPPTCFYVDIGARLTAVSLISEGAAYGSLVIRSGGADIDEKISNALGIPLDSAKQLKEDYGYDTRVTAYQPPVYRDRERGIRIRQSELNKIYESHFEDFGIYVNNAIKTLAERQGAETARNLTDVPIVLGGGGSMLYGIERLLEAHRGKRQLIRYLPKVVGAYDASMVSLLGMIMMSGSYRGALSDDGHRIGTLSRAQ